MGHATPDELRDLAPLLERVRSWDLVRETARNVFYVKRLPFLHFHTKDGERFADVRSGAAWGSRLAIPFDATRRARDAFAKEVERRHAETVAAVAAKRR